MEQLALSTRRWVLRLVGVGMLLAGMLLFLALFGDEPGPSSREPAASGEIPQGPVMATVPPPVTATVETEQAAPQDDATKVPAALTGPGTAKIEQVGEAVVHVIDPMGAPLEAADVWLADTWYKPRDLRRMSHVPHGRTGADGTVVLQVRAGRYCVHVTHPDYVCSSESKYGNGDRAVLRVSERAETTLRMYDVYVLAYEFAPVGVVAVEALEGTGLEYLRRTWTNMALGSLVEVEERIRLRWPNAKVRARFHVGEGGSLGTWKVNVCWVGRTPTSIPIAPVPLREFAAPIVIGLGDSVPSNEFGTVFLHGPEGFLIQAHRVDLDSRPRSFLVSRLISYDIRLGEIVTLPSGVYEFDCEERPFLTSDLRRDGRLTVSAGSYEERQIVFQRPLRSVQIDMQLPPGYTRRVFLGEVASMSDRGHLGFGGTNEFDNTSWWLPTGDYRLRVMMATESEAGLFLQCETFFSVAAGSEPQVVRAELVPTVVPPRPPVQFVAPSSTGGGQVR